MAHPLPVLEGGAGNSSVRWYALPVAGVAAVIGTFSVVSPPLALVTVVGAIFIFAAFREVAAGVSFFTMLTFVQGVSGVIRPALGIAGIILVLALLRRRGAPSLARERPALAYAVLLLAVWGAGSALWAPDLGASVFPAFQLALVVALMFVVFSCVREARHVRWIIWSYIAGAAISAVLALVMPAPEAGRVAGGVGDPNFLAAMLVSGLALVPFTFSSTRAHFTRSLLAGCALLFVITLFLTQSRGGLFALGGLLVGALLFGGPLRPHALVMGLVISALAIGYYAFVVPPEARERITNPSGGSGRTDIWAVATRVAADHPITGVGIGNFTVVEASYAAQTVNLQAVTHVVDLRQVPHNTYLGILVELGAVGLAAFAAIIVGSLALARRAVRAFVRSGERELEMLTRGVMIAVIALLTAFVFLSAEYDKRLWLLLGLLAALATAGRRAVEKLDPRSGSR